MTNNRDQHTEDDALATLTSLARQCAPSATAAQLGQGWATVSSRLAARDTRRRGLIRMATVGATAGAIALAVLGIVSWSRTLGRPTSTATLAYKIEGGSVVNEGYLRESGNAGVKLHFAEGTEFALAPGARGRLRAVDSAGARIAIEMGTASFRVTPRSNARWLVDVGPFLVTVKGTVFTVSWEPSTEKLELSMQHGQVLVTGPLSQEGVALRAGQRLAVNLPKKEILITEPKPEDAWLGAAPVADSTPAGSLASERPPAPPGPAVAGQTTTPGTTSTGSKGERRRWADALAAGDWDQILADVDRAGVKRTLAEASSEDLFVLADAARYRMRPGLARNALLTERRRYPSSPRALDAAFLLGRLEESNGRGAGKALAWYEEYLSRAPNGTYASEALGRKMMATSKLRGPAAALSLAEDYLRRFPGGTYAGAARALLRAP
jgi:hypothetical protein